ncbi:hypothetical protein ACQP00_21025 [Dactylosporangium sp. CS-047395]|uniref:hypothetical protein n=1 Tax=Dactylosporangium sp. CS-047395 TaxID=3239936 RepID=UPI003D91DC7B
MTTTFVVGVVAALAVSVAAMLTDFGKSVVEDAADAPAIAVTAIVERDQNIQGETWILPDPLQPLPQDDALLSNPYGQQSDKDAGNIEPFRAWARTHGGADPEVTFLKLIVEGRRRSTIRVINVSAVVMDRKEPLSGTLLAAGPEGGGALTQIGFNLDENDPVARTVDEDTGEFGKPYFSATETKTLDRGEQEVFQITASTHRAFVQWCVEVKLLIDSKIQTHRKCPESGPLRTTAFKWKAGVAIKDRTGHDIDTGAYQSLYTWAFDQYPNRFVRKDPQQFHW